MFDERLLAWDITPSGIATVLGSLYKPILVACFAVYLVYWSITPKHKVVRLSDRKSKKNLSENRRRRKIGNLPPVFPNGWYPILEKDQLKKNEISEVEALGECFAVFRKQNGEISIVDAYCPHLGANIAAGGKVVGDCVECPFHQWQFSGVTGECTHAPTAEKVPKTAKLKTWHSFECHDYIHVWYHAENEEPSWYPDPLTQLNDLTMHGRFECEINCHIQDMIENLCDLSHFATVHGPIASTGDDLRTYTKWSNIIRNRNELTLFMDTKNEKRPVIRLAMEHSLTLFDKYHLKTGVYHIFQIGPGISSVCFETWFGTFYATISIVTVEPLVQKMIHRYYGPWYSTPIIKLLVFTNLYIMVNRDANIWHHKTYIDKPTLLKEESSLLKFRRWFNQFYTEHSPTYEQARRTTEW